MTRRINFPPTSAAPPSRWPFLPIALAIGILPAMCSPARGEDTVSLPRTGLYRIIPSSVRFPDGYAVDLTRDPPWFAEAVNTDTIAELRMWAPVKNSWVSLDIKDETPHIGSGGTLMQLRFQYRF